MVPEGKVKILYKTSEKEDKLKSLTASGTGRKMEILYETSEREDKLKSLTVCGAGRKIEIL